VLLVVEVVVDVGGADVVVVVVLVVDVVDVVVDVVDVVVVVVGIEQTTGKKTGSAQNPVGTTFIVVLPSGTTVVYNPGDKSDPKGIFVKKGTA
jgi:hypothetical protein